jgi:hypothetical protein
MATTRKLSEKPGEEWRIENRTQSSGNPTVSAQENPLVQYSPTELEGLADKFAQEHGLEDVRDDIRKGALLAQNGSEYESYGLTGEELDAVTDEINHSGFIFTNLTEEELTEV